MDRSIIGSPISKCKKRITGDPGNGGPPVPGIIQRSKINIAVAQRSTSRRSVDQVLPCNKLANAPEFIKSTPDQRRESGILRHVVISAKIQSQYRVVNLM